MNNIPPPVNVRDFGGCTDEYREKRDERVAAYLNNVRDRVKVVHQTRNQTVASPYDDPPVKRQIARLEERLDALIIPAAYDDTELRNRVGALELAVSELLTMISEPVVEAHDGEALADILKRLDALESALRLSTRGDKVTLGALDDMHQRIKGVESAVSADVFGALAAVDELRERIEALETSGSDAFIRSQIQDDESFEDARKRVLARFEVLFNKGRNKPLIGDELVEYTELSRGLGKG